MTPSLVYFLSSYWQYPWRRVQHPSSAWKQTQHQRLHWHLKWVHQHSPFYRERVSAEEVHNLSAWPIMDKAGMQQHFDRLNTKGLHREELLDFALERERDRKFEKRFASGINVGLSSGTSGSRGLFVTTPREEAIWAGAAMARVLPFSIGTRQRVALILRANNPLYEEAGGKWIRFRFFDLLNPQQEIAKGLRAYQPTLLVAPPSVLVELLKKDPALLQELPLDRVTCAAEVLQDQDRDLISTCSPCPVHQLYQATEGFLASTCREGNLHMHEDMHHVEWEAIPGRANCFTPLITDLRRTTQPHIRYRLNDVLEINPEPCPCGCTMTRIHKIHGRCDDLLVFPGKTGGRVTVFPDLLTRVLLRSGETLEEFRVTQQQDGEMRLELKGPVTLQEDIQMNLQAFARELNAELPPVTYHPWSPSPAGSKCRRIRRVA